MKSSSEKFRKQQNELSTPQVLFMSVFEASTEMSHLGGKAAIFDISNVSEVRWFANN